MSDWNEHQAEQVRTVIALEKVLLTALGRRWTPAGFSLETLCHDVAARIATLEAEVARLRGTTAPEAMCEDMCPHSSTLYARGFAAAREAAAKVCDNRAHALHSLPDPDDSRLAVVASDCAHFIRALRSEVQG